jgi:hypothetical protein
MVIFAELGAVYWKLNRNDYDNNQELSKIREARGYGYMLILYCFSSSIHFNYSCSIFS